MNYKLLKADVLAFRALAGNIKVDERLPILRYLLLRFGVDGCTITKNGQKSYLIKTYDTPGEGAILVDENVLYNFVDQLQEEEFEALPQGDTILLRGLNIEDVSPTEPAVGYPAVALATGSGSVLTPETLKQIGIAADYIIEEEVPTPKSHLFIGDGYIAASDASIAYLYPCDSEKTVLRKEAAVAVGKLTGCEYIRNGNYDVFITLNTQIGFIKPEITYFNLTSLISADCVEEFCIKKADIIRFCTHCINTTPNKLIIATIEQHSSGGVVLKMKDAAFNRNVEIRAEATGYPAAPFKFNVHNMMRLLKGLAVEDLRFAPGKKRYYIKDDKFTALIMSLI